MHTASKRSGRISFVSIAAVFAVALLAFLFFSAGASPRTAAIDFMSSLAKGDVEKLTDLSLIQDRNKDQIHAQWQEAMKYGKNYRFVWQIGAIKTDGDTATARIDVTKSPSPEAATDKYELILKKVDGAWKVDVAQITRDMFPYLPQ
jgi:hypothetical protein